MNNLDSEKILQFFNEYNKSATERHIELVQRISVIETNTKGIQQTMSSLPCSQHSDSIKEIKTEINLVKKIWSGIIIGIAGLLNLIFYYFKR